MKSQIKSLVLDVGCILLGMSCEPKNTSASNPSAFETHSMESSDKEFPFAFKTLGRVFADTAAVNDSNGNAVLICWPT
jgi:hypothetical protein